MGTLSTTVDTTLFTPTLTEWDRKYRAKLLFLETRKCAECQEKRRIAEDSNTTAEGLDRCASPMQSVRNYPLSTKYYLLAEAIVAHPNVPVKLLIMLFERSYNFCSFALCRNPATPFLALETPDFWERMTGIVYARLLSEETLPLPVAQALNGHKEDVVAQSARLHLTIAGEIQNGEEGVATLRASDFSQYIARTHPPFDLYTLRKKGLSPFWVERLHAVLQLPLTGEPFPKSTYEHANRSPLDLLRHLARDGNRLVRWAAQTRLADPDYVFPF